MFRHKYNIIVNAASLISKSSECTSYHILLFSFPIHHPLLCYTSIPRTVNHCQLQVPVFLVRSVRNYFNVQVMSCSLRPSLLSCRSPMLKQTEKADRRDLMLNTGKSEGSEFGFDRSYAFYLRPPAWRLRPPLKINFYLQVRPCCVIEADLCYYVCYYFRYALFIATTIYYFTTEVSFIFVRRFLLSLTRLKLIRDYISHCMR